MEPSELHKIIVNNINTLMNDPKNSTPSMRYLSTCIGANESYIQKITSGTALPSLDKLVAIANHFEIDTWTLLFDNTKNAEVRLEVIELLSKCPNNMLPVIRAYIEYILNCEPQK